MEILLCQPDDPGVDLHIVDTLYGVFEYLIQGAGDSSRDQQHLLRFFPLQHGMMHIFFILRGVQGVGYQHMVLIQVELVACFADHQTAERGLAMCQDLLVGIKKVQAEKIHR